MSMTKKGYSYPIKIKIAPAQIIQLVWQYYYTTFWRKIQVPFSILFLRALSRPKVPKIGRMLNQIFAVGEIHRVCLRRTPKACLEVCPVPARQKKADHKGLPFLLGVTYEKDTKLKADELRQKRMTF